jgi:hypothetical protein
LRRFSAARWRRRAARGRTPRGAPPTYAAAIGASWTQDDEALVDSLVTPGLPSTPGYNDLQYPFYGGVRRA